MRFEECLKRILKHEGGFVNDPLDSGGMTNLGVTKRVWEEFVGHPVSEADMQALIPERVAKLYKQRYWNPAYCEVLPKGLDYVVFDFAVNAGTGRSVKTLQQAIGCVADGVIGPKTMAAINSANAKNIIAKFSDARTDFYQGIVARKPDQARFIKGWLNRVEDARKLALEEYNQDNKES
ncbi:MAG: glycosyl hydrolase 108 family protein [Actinomycetes bacterium]|jgi:lysozyme family protein